MQDAGPGTATLLESGISALQQLLGADWKISPLAEPDGVQATSRNVIDARIRVAPADDGVSTEFLIHLKQEITPRSVDEQLLPVLSALRLAQARQTLLVVAPWIGPRTQKQLRDYGISYLDLTGNVDLRVTQPRILIHTEGAANAPRSVAATSGVKLTGSKVERLVRLLADYEPPCRAVDIAMATQMSASYVSRVLDQLEDQLLIRREARVVTDIDWIQLLRARAENYDLLRHNPYVSMVAPNGTSSVLSDLREITDAGATRTDIAVTGPFAAREIAPLTAGGQLMLYVSDDPLAAHGIGDRLGLLQVSEGADVLILRAHDNVVFERHRIVDGIPHVALSQLVLDGLAGPGRMPAEAEAVLAYMSSHPKEWRRPGPPPVDN